jgi:DNA-binding protein HU-beta
MSSTSPDATHARFVTAPVRHARLRHTWADKTAANFQRRTLRPRGVNGNPCAKCDNGREMARPAKITTAFPSVLETAKRLGVSKHDAEVLSEMAERSERTGKFVIPGLGHLVRVGRKYRTARNPATGETIRIPAKKVVKFRVAKSAKDAIAPSTKK